MNQILMSLAAAWLGAGCTAVAPDAGHEAVLVEKPYLFGHGGVSPSPVSTGRIYAALSTDTVYVDMRPIQFDEKFDDLMSKDNFPLDFHAYPRLRITDSVRIVRDFGTEWYQRNVQQHFRNMVRDEAKSHSMTDLAVNQTVVVDMQQGVTKALGAYLKAQQIPAEVLDVTIGKVSPNRTVLDSLSQTAAQQQRIKTEQERKNAEDARRLAEESRANADRAYQVKMGLSPEQFVRLQSVIIEKEMVSICANGKAGCTLILGGGAHPAVTVK